KEGFLRSERSLIQTMGRAARNDHGEVIMYADTITNSMQLAIDETNRRREIQQAYNEEHGITPKTIIKEVRDVIQATVAVDGEEVQDAKLTEINQLPKKEKQATIEKMEEEMREAAKLLDFEKATELRDIIFELKAEG